MALVASEQRVDMRTRSITRENEDVEKFVQCFSQPFPTMSVCIDVAFKAFANCHLYHELGCKGISKIVGVYFGNVKFKRKSLHLRLSSTVQILNKKYF
ncbi:hypothetical protein AVEN_61245-1 [Araneus ventricosus]|uniref:Uncharacterized protein n=1 Tax=Araneus ventricosus TaxID=182803 RepID=A0A4Y2TW47_ARAVE|nr:hypothetical protein AVEN_61245-1 [Araneus ventricosus]